MSNSHLTVGVVGLGAMGAGMAAVLAKAGFTTNVYDLSADAVMRAETSGAHACATASDVIATSQVIVLSLPAAKHVTSVITDALDNGAFGTQPKIIIDASTSEAETSRDLAAVLAPLGHVFLDAPVSGGPAAAAQGTLSIMIGGDENGINRAMPVLEALSAKVIHVGPVGTGNVAKLVNNMLVACHMITTREAMKLADASGVRPEDALRVVNTATGRSAISEIHFPNWVIPETYNSGFSTGLMRKDVRLALEMAGDLDLPMSRLANALWAEENSGLNDKDDFMLMGKPETSKENGNV